MLVTFSVYFGFLVYHFLSLLANFSQVKMANCANDRKPLLLSLLLFNFFLCGYYLWAFCDLFWFYFPHRHSKSTCAQLLGTGALYFWDTRMYPSDTCIEFAFFFHTFFSFLVCVLCVFFFAVFAFCFLYSFYTIPRPKTVPVRRLVPRMGTPVSPSPGEPPKLPNKVAVVPAGDGAKIQSRVPICESS